MTDRPHASHTTTAATPTPPTCPSDDRPSGDHSPDDHPKRTRENYVRWTEADHALAVQLRAEGQTLRTIAARLGVTVRRVRARLKNSDERPTSQSAPRKCLCCLQTFASAGPFNRMCRTCKDAV